MSIKDIFYHLLTPSTCSGNFAAIGYQLDTFTRVKLSRHFGLGRTQHELDFVDIDLDNDTPLFLDPHFLSLRADRWSTDATRSIRSFFRHFLSLVRAQNRDAAYELFEHLSEPNETRLGLSAGRSQGRSVGAKDSRAIFESLLRSRAVQTGLVEDIEDCRLFVDNIDKDKVSDIATNIIRRHLIEYTQRQCKLWNIPLTAGVPSGSLWNGQYRRWEQTHTDMLVVGNRSLLLVPKGIVCFTLQYTPSRYHQHFVLNFLQAHHLRINSALVKTRAKRVAGRPNKYVTKKSIKESEAPLSKEYLISFTAAHPDVFQNFKAQSTNHSSIAAQDLSTIDIPTVVDRLIAELGAIPPGAADADRFNSTVMGILELIFYPKLIDPVKEREINDGRKRIDIVFCNAAESGFFYRAHNVNNTPCPFIIVECKNYSNDLRNPELDQLIARLTPNRGKVGIIVCRTLDDHALFMRRCADAYVGQQGIVIPLIDADLIEMLGRVKAGDRNPEEGVFTRKFREIALA